MSCCVMPCDVMYYIMLCDVCGSMHLCVIGIDMFELGRGEWVRGKMKGMGMRGRKEGGVERRRRKRGGMGRRGEEEGE